MKRRVALVLFASLSFAGAPSRAAPETIDSCSGWSVGQRLAFESRRLTEIRDEGQEKVRVASMFPVQLEVVGRDESGFLIAWTYGQTVVEENTAGPLEAWQLSLLDGLRVELRTDASGRVTGVANARRVKEFLIGARGRLLDELQRLAVSDEERAEVGRVLTEFTSPQRSSNLPLPDAEFLLQHCGRSLALGKPQRFERASAALGGRPTGVFVSFVLRKLDREAKRATVEWRNEEDAASMEFLRGLFRIAAKGQPMQRFEVRDAGVMELDLSSGWLARVSHEQSLRYGENLRLQRSELRLVPQQGDASAN